MASGVLLATFSVNLSAQARSALVSGTVAAGQGRVIGALVTIDSAGVIRATRSDADGRFRFANVSRGHHELSVSSVGFLPFHRDLEITDSSVDVAVTLQQRTQVIDSVVVHAGRTGVFGVIASATDLSPIAGTNVEVLGALASQLTDAAGRYDLPKVRAGSYVVRITRDGFAERLLSIRVSKDSAYELSVLLDPAVAQWSAKQLKRREYLMHDMETRVRFGGMNAGLITHDQLGPDPRAGVLASMNRFQKIGNPCVFVDGVPLPGWSPDAFDVREVEAVEMYGPDTPPGRRLESEWPLGIPCASLEDRPNLRSMARALDPKGVTPTCTWCTGLSSAQGTIFVVIWLRR